MHCAVGALECQWVCTESPNSTKTSATGVSRGSTLLTGPNGTGWDDVASGG
jgi:hypothetical protein